MNYRNLLIIVALSIVFIAAKKHKTKVFTLKKFKNSISKIDSNLYASKYETSNFLYRTFLNDLKKQGKTEKLKIAQIDSLNWRTPLAYNEPYVDLYHKHPAFNEYPVVNVSYEGANLFCEWLTNKYNNYHKRKFKKVKFRLPTQVEWEKAARGNLKNTIYPWGGYNTINHKGEDFCNYLKISQANIHYDSLRKQLVIIKDDTYCDGKTDLQRKHKILGCVPEPINWYSPNSFDIYNISGNVAEMVQQKGIIRGGSMCSPGYDVRIESIDIYNKSETYIGFRYFMEVIEF